jgi:hypothetical protein
MTEHQQINLTEQNWQVYYLPNCRMHSYHERHWSTTIKIKTELNWESHGHWRNGCLQNTSLKFIVEPFLFYHMITFRKPMTWNATTWSKNMPYIFHINYFLPAVIQQMRWQHWNVQMLPVEKHKPQVSLKDCIATWLVLLLIARRQLTNLSTVKV